MNNSNQTEPCPELHRVIVEKLFGLFDHDISLNRSAGVTIIYGANGVGKTRIFQVLNALSRRRFGIIYNTPFRRLALEFVDETRFEILQDEIRSRDNRDHLQKGKRDLELNLIRLGCDRVSKMLTSRDEDVDALLEHWTELKASYLNRVGPDHWINEITNETLTSDDVVKELMEKSELPPRVRRVLEDQEDSAPDEIDTFLSNLRIDFIDTHRLNVKAVGSGSERWSRRSNLLRSRSLPKRTVDVYAEDLSREIEDYLTKYAGISSRFDRTFPQRALSLSENEESTDKVREQYDKLTKLRERLASTGILEETDELPSWPDRELDKTERRFLALYLEDTQEKLAVFDGLLGRLELLAKILDERFLFKKMRTDYKRGFFFVSSLEQELGVDQLSSGEQHELILAYRLLFKLESSSLVLIDEPEISLNVAWQQKFLDDIIEIRDLTNIKFLIATHSPQIIHNRWDLARELGNHVE